MICLIMLYGSKIPSFLPHCHPDLNTFLTLKTFKSPLFPIHFKVHIRLFICLIFLSYHSATIASIDSCMWAATGHMEDDLSEQHLMDCANGHTYFDSE